MKIVFKSALLAAVSIFSSVASAQAVEWRLIGPSASWHADQNTGRVVTPLHLTEDGEIVNAKREWSQTNPSLGLERSVVYAEHTDKLYITMIRDSFAQKSVMLGVARTYPILTAGSFRFEAGASAGLWARSFSNGEKITGYVYDNAGNWGAVTETVLSRKIIPYVLPVLTVTEKNTGLGLNLSVMPKIVIGGQPYVPTTTVMVQLTYKLKF